MVSKPSLSLMALSSLVLKHMVMDTLVFHTSSLAVLPQLDVVTENGTVLSERSVTMETLLMAMDAPSLVSAKVACQRVMALATQATPQSQFSHLDLSSHLDIPTALAQLPQEDQQPLPHIQ
jgi:hypothetical protein